MRKQTRSFALGVASGIGIGFFLVGATAFFLINGLIGKITRD